MDGSGNNFANWAAEPLTKRAGTARTTQRRRKILDLAQSIMTSLHHVRGHMEGQIWKTRKVRSGLLVYRVRLFVFLVAEIFLAYFLFSYAWLYVALVPNCGMLTLIYTKGISHYNQMHLMITDTSTHIFSRALSNMLAIKIQMEIQNEMARYSQSAESRNLL